MFKKRYLTYSAGPMESVSLDDMTGWRNEISEHLTKLNINVYDPVEQENKKVGKTADSSIAYMNGLKAKGDWKTFYDKMFNIWFGTISPNTDLLTLLQHLRMRKHIETENDKYFDNMGDAEAVVRSDFLIAYVPDVRMVGTIYEVMIAFLFRIPTYFIFPDKKLEEINSSLLFGGMISNNGELKAYSNISDCIKQITKDFNL